MAASWISSYKGPPVSGRNSEWSRRPNIIELSTARTTLMADFSSATTLKNGQGVSYRQQYRQNWSGWKMASVFQNRSDQPGQNEEPGLKTSWDRVEIVGYGQFQSLRC